MAIRKLIVELECHLQALGFWDESAPDAAALASDAPFAVDALEFYQWLQWIFIPTMYEQLDRDADLPGNCCIAPMAEEWLKARKLAANDMLACLQAIDKALG